MAVFSVGGSVPVQDAHVAPYPHDIPASGGAGARVNATVRSYPSWVTPDAIIGVVEVAPVGLLLTDAKGTILLVNRQIELMFDYPRAWLIGQPVELLVPPRLRATHHHHWESLTTEPTVRSTGTEIALTGLRRDGIEFPAEVSLSRLQPEGSPRTVWLVRDTSERLDADRQLIQAERDRAVADDRQRIAGALLDQVVQRLFAASLAVQSIHGRTDDPSLQDRLTAAVEEIDAAIADLRSSVFELA